MTEERRHPWLDAFWKNPVEAIGILLSKQFYMGTLNVASPPDILEGLARGLPKSVHFTKTLDEALREWLKIRFRQEPHLPAGLFARGLVDAFSLVARIDMPLTLEWLRDNLEEVRIWLRSFHQGKTRDPEGALLRTLALKQPDRSLLPVWYRLVDLSEPLPLYYYSLGILGLRCMPDTRDEKQRDINPEVFVGVLRLGSALQKRPDGQNLWKKELQSLMAVYPRSEKYWFDNLLPLIEGKYRGVYAWLDSEISAIAEVKKQFRKKSKRIARIRFREPPSKEEMERLLDLLNKVSYEEFQKKVEGLQSRHRKIAQESGNSDIFVRFLCNIAKRVQSNYVKLAEELLTEANIWAPYDPFVWTQLENIYRQQGDFEKGELVGWEASHRFPENVYVHTGLAETLKAEGKLGEAEILYRKTIKEFPNNVVARTGLAEILKAEGKLGEAEILYRKTIKEFPNNVAARTGLAVVFFLRSKPEEAISLLEEVITEFPNNKYAPRILAEARRKEGDYTGAEKILKEAYEDEMVEMRLYPLTPKDERVAIPEAEPEVAPGVKVVGVTPRVGPLPLDLSPIAVGFGNLYRHYGRWLQKKKKAISKAKEFFDFSSQWIEKGLKQNPCNLYALAEKGWLLADRGDILSALSHFEQGSRQYPHNVALHLGLIRMKARQRTIKPDSSEWDKIGEKFPGLRQVFCLEQARYSLYSPNGYTSANLSKLQKELTLPQWIAKSEKEAYEWFAREVKSKLFHSVGLRDEYPTATIEQLRINNEEYGVELDELAEVYAARK